MAELMNTREVAEYLRLKERKIYDLVREKRIPCTRVTGKWLFPKRLVDAWLAKGPRFPRRSGATPPAPPVITAAMIRCWSGACANPAATWRSWPAAASTVCAASPRRGDGVRAARGRPRQWRIQPAVVEALGADGVLIEWARREQGLVVAPGNPLAIRAIADLARPDVRVVLRQQGAGSRILLEHLLDRAGVALEALHVLDQPARSETDLGQAISEGRADAGLAVAAAAHAFRLDFVPLWQERCDLLIRRRDYFEAPVQALLAFTRTPAFTRRATEMSGYDVAATGRIVWNAP